jgi:hypothetical protein
MAQRANLTCPTCGAELTPIVYGMPGLELFEAADRDEVKLGGCEIRLGNPDFECRGVNHHLWQRKTAADH